MPKHENACNAQTRIPESTTPSRTTRPKIAMDWVEMKVRSYDAATGKYYDTILVITDRLTRLTVLIPTTKDASAEDTLTQSTV